MLFSFIAGLVSVNFCETILNNEKVIKKIKPFTIKKNLNLTISCVLGSDPNSDFVFLKSLYNL